MGKSTGCSCRGQDGAHLAGVSALVLWPVGKRQCQCDIRADHPSAPQLSSMFSSFRGQGSKETSPDSQRRAWTTSAGLLSRTAPLPQIPARSRPHPFCLLCSFTNLEFPLTLHLLVYSVFFPLPFCALSNRLLLDCIFLYWSVCLVLLF